MREFPLCFPNIPNFWPVVYKDDGDIIDENNYRPISVIDHIAKTIESLVSYQIIDVFGRA